MAIYSMNQKMYDSISLQKNHEIRLTEEERENALNTHMLAWEPEGQIDDTIEYDYYYQMERREFSGKLKKAKKMSGNRLSHPQVIEYVNETFKLCVPIYDIVIN